MHEGEWLKTLASQSGEETRDLGLQYRTDTLYGTGGEHVCDGGMMEMTHNYIRYAEATVAPGEASDGMEEARCGARDYGINRSRAPKMMEKRQVPPARKWSSDLHCEEPGPSVTVYASARG